MSRSIRCAVSHTTECSCRALRAAMATVCVALVAVSAHARDGQTWIVDDDGPADFPSIQSAITAASSGDTIRVQPGQYGRIDYLGKRLSIISTGGASVTVIDGQLVQGAAAVRRVDSQGPALLDGFTVRGGTFIGYAASGTGWGGGGGVAVANAELDIVRCVIEGNGGGMYGGGVGCIRGTVRITDTVVRQNWAGQGGGINGWIADIRCERVQVLDNRSTLFGAGGIDMWSHSYGLMDRLELIDVVLSGNVADPQWAGPIWNGIYNGGEMIVDNVSIESIVNAGWVRFASNRGPSVLDIAGSFGFVHGSIWFGASMGRIQVNVHGSPDGPRADLVRVAGTLGVENEFDQSGSLGLLDVSVLPDANVDVNTDPIPFLQFAAIDRGFTMFGTRGLPSATLMEYSIGASGGAPSQQLRGSVRPISAGSGSLIDSRILPAAATSLAVADLEGDGYPDVCVGMTSTLPGWQGQVVLARNAGIGVDGGWLGLSGESTIIGLPGVPRAIAGGDFGGDAYTDLALGLGSGQVMTLASQWSGGSTPTFVTSVHELVSAGLSSVAADGLVGLTPMASGRGRIAVQDAISGTVATVALPPLPVDMSCACEGRFGVGMRVRASVANPGGTGLPTGAEGTVVFGFSQPVAGHGSIVVQWDGWTGGSTWSNLCGANPCCGDFAGSAGQQLSLVPCEHLVSPSLSIESRMDPTCAAGGVAGSSDGSTLVAACSDAGVLNVQVTPPSGGTSALVSIELLQPQSDVAIADINGDGIDDVIAALPAIDTVAIALRAPAAVAEFLPWFPLPVGGSPVRIGAGDIDGDGDVDLAVLTELPDGNAAIELYRNTSAVGGSSVSLDLIGLADVGDGVPTDFALADMSGNGKVDLIVLVTPAGAGLAETASSLRIFGIADETPKCSADLNADAMVDGTDLGILLAGWGVAGGGMVADINGDGVVNGLDLAELLATWGACPR